MRAPNKLELVLVPAEGRDAPYAPVEIRVDGRSLVEWLRGIEAPSAAAEGHPGIAGAYDHLTARATFLPSRHLLGEPTPELAHDDKTVLLLCDCGVAGCWDFVCRIRVDADTVTWSDFAQVHRKWDYSALGTLVFSRAEYEVALAAPPTSGG